MPKENATKIRGANERERERESKRLRRFVKYLFSFLFSLAIFFTVHSSVYAATYYVSTTGNDSYTTIQAQNTATPWKTLSKAYLTHVNAGDTIALKRGDVWYEGLQIYYGGSAGNPVTWTAYGTGDLPVIKGSNLDTSWTQDGSNWYTSYNMVVAWGGAVDQYGVWEDGAPLFNVSALANIRPGTFFYDSGTSRLYVRTYESDDPHNHILEHSRHWDPSASAISITDSTGGVATDYLVISNIKAEKGQNAGVAINATANAKNSITLQYMVIAGNMVGVSYNGTFAQTININNSVIWGNAYTAISSYNAGANTATVNVKNSILGGTLFFNTFEPATGGTVNIDHSIVSGNLQGRYFLTNVNNGTLNITNTSYESPRFAAAGGNGLGVATFNSDDSEGSGYHLSVANIFNSRGLKYVWSITSKLDPGQWPEVNAVLAANQIIGIHTRNHNQMSSSPGGSDIVNAFSVNYTGGTTVTASYADPIFILTIDGVSTNINVSTENARTCGAGTYDTTYLGDATHGLLGCIKALSANYAVAYPTTQSASISRVGSAYYVSSRVLSDQTNVNIKSPNCSTTIGCIALDASRYSNSEIFTAGQRDGEYADWDAQTGAIVGHTTTAFSYPFEEWSVAEIARLYARGIKTAYAGDTVNSMTVARHQLFNQLYPLNLPIAAPYASGLQMTMNTTQNGIDEAENVSALLDAYPVLYNLFSHGPTEVSLDAMASFLDTLQANGTIITDRTAAEALDVASGGVWDTSSYTITRKIIPTYNFQLKSDSPAINSGTNLSLTFDSAGNSVPQGSAPDIGAYEYIPLTVTINQAARQSDPTNSTINFTVIFSESVSDFVTGDVTLSGTAGATTATVTGSGTTYNIAVTGMTGPGTVIATLAAGVATGATSNTNAVSTSTDNMVTYDSVTPTGGSITYSDGKQDSTSVTLTVSDGTDSESGVNTATRSILRKSATLSGDSCENYSSFTATTVSGTYPNFVDSGVARGNCYQYEYQVSDNAGNTATYTSSSTAKILFSTPSTPVCTDTTPIGTTPWLYEANSNNGNSITLRFTNWQSPVDHFALEYGTESNKYTFGVTSFGNKDTNSYTIASLSPNKTYYFRVRTGNGCATGSWSNELSAKTLGLTSFNNLDITESELEAVAPSESNSCENYTVKSGDTLWQIAMSLLGDGNKYKEISSQNSDSYPSLKTSNNLNVGWNLKINCQSEADKTSKTTTQQLGYLVNVKVKDTKGNTIEGAEITIHSVVQTKKTDNNGVASFSNVEAGNHLVQIAYNNYQGEQSINLTGDVKEFNLNITIEAKNAFLSPQVLAVIGALVLVIAFLAFKLIRKNKLKKL